MPYRLLADMVVVVHLLFILYVIFGGLLLLRWRRLVWPHLAAFGWAVAIEIGGWICPLTPLENRLRQLDDASSTYQNSFIEQYLLPVIYPANLTRERQWLLAAAVVAVNLVVYGLVYRHYRRKG